MVPGDDAMTEPVRFNATITIRCQPELPAQVDRVARARGSKPSECARQALQIGLRAMDFDTANIPASDTDDSRRASVGGVAA